MPLLQVRLDARRWVWLSKTGQKPSRTIRGLIDGAMRAEAVKRAKRQEQDVEIAIRRASHRIQREERLDFWAAYERATPDILTSIMAGPNEELKKAVARWRIRICDRGSATMQRLMKMREKC